MNILHVVQSYEERMGGGPRYMRDLSVRFARRGHSVHVWTTNAAEGEYFWDRRKLHVAPGRETIDGVHVRRFPVRHLPFHWKAARLLALCLPGGLKAYFDPPSPLVPGLWRPKFDADLLPDVIHAASFPLDTLLWPVFRAARRRGIPFILTPLIHFGRGDEDSAEVQRYFGRAHQAKMLRQSAAIFVLSSTEAEYAVARGAAPERVVVLPLGIDPEALAGGDGERLRRKHGIAGPIVLHIATKAVAKGSATLVEAMKRLWADGSPACLVMLGPSMPCFREYMTAQRDLPDDRFFDLGFVSEEEKRDALAAATLMAMPSRADAFGLAYLEAWFYGKPVIGARAGGVQDLIEDGADGRLVEFDDADGLAATINELITDEKLAEKLGNAGREKVLARYTQEHEFAVVEDVYEAVVRGSDPAPHNFEQ